MTLPLLELCRQRHLLLKRLGTTVNLLLQVLKAQWIRLNESFQNMVCSGDEGCQMKVEHLCSASRLIILVELKLALDDRRDGANIIWRFRECCHKLFVDNSADTSGQRIV